MVAAQWKREIIKGWLLFIFALVELFPAHGKRFVHILTSRDSRATPRDSVRTPQLLLTQRHGNSWVSGCALGSGCIASLTLSDLCVCVAFPVSVCVNSYMCLPLCTFIFKYCMLWRRMEKTTTALE